MNVGDRSSLREHGPGSMNGRIVWEQVLLQGRSRVVDQVVRPFDMDFCVTLDVR